MKKLSRLFLTIAGIIFLGACAKEELRGPTASETPPLTRSYLISMDSLQRLAVSLPGSFGEEPATRSSGKMIREVLPLNDFLNSPATRSGSVERDPTQDIYVVNYEDDAGFAILSADTRLDGVLAYSDRGNISDPLSNPGLKMFIGNIPDYASMQLSQSVDTFLPGFETYKEELLLLNQVTAVKGPFLTTRWHQGSPFNDRMASNGCSHKHPAGCSAIAALQIMTYHEYPASINCPWEGMTPLTPEWRRYKTVSDYEFGNSPDITTAIATLTSHIGHMIGTDYSCNESGTTMKKALRGITDMGYRTDGIYSLHMDRIRQDIDNGLPVYIGGHATDNWIGYSDGHVWVIDGYKSFYDNYRVYRHYYDGRGNFLRTEDMGIRSGGTSYWVHCNWG